MREQLARLLVVAIAAGLPAGCGGGSSASTSASTIPAPLLADMDDATSGALDPAVNEKQFSGECWAVQIHHYYQYGAAPNELVSSWPWNPCEGCMVRDLWDGAPVKEACNYCDYAIRVDCTIRSTRFPGAWDDAACWVGDDRMGISSAVTDGFSLVVDEQRIDPSGTSLEVDGHLDANTALGVFAISFSLRLTRVSDGLVLGGGMSAHGPLRVHALHLPVGSDEGDVSACPTWGSN